MKKKQINQNPLHYLIMKLGHSYEIPILKGTEGPNVLDITSLFKDTGMFTYDPGYTSTASCSSSITYIDGHKGI